MTFYDVLPYIIVFVVYVIGEVIWLTLMSRNYSRWFAAYNPSLKIQSFLAFFVTYIVLLGSFAYLVLSRSTSNIDALLLGGAFGLVVYSTYNCVNKATLPKYEWTMVVVDTLWGTLWFGLLSILFYQSRFVLKSRD